MDLRPASPETFLGLLSGAPALREVFTGQYTQIMDLTREWTSVSRWNLDGGMLPEALLPDVDASLPEFTLEFRDRLIAEQSLLAEQHLRLARTRLLFGGKPVSGRRAISTDFAAEALSRYQNLISVAFSARLHWTLGSRGRIPDRNASALFLADMPRGSVGFELIEIQEKPQSRPSHLAEVVAEVGELIEAAASDVGVENQHRLSRCFASNPCD